MKSDLLRQMRAEKCAAYSTNPPLLLVGMEADGRKVREVCACGGPAWVVYFLAHKRYSMLSYHPRVVLEKRRAPLICSES